MGIVPDPHTPCKKSVLQASREQHTRGCARVCHTIACSIVTQRCRRAVAPHTTAASHRRRAAVAQAVADWSHSSRAGSRRVVARRSRRRSQSCRTVATWASRCSCRLVAPTRKGNRRFVAHGSHKSRAPRHRPRPPPQAGCRLPRSQIQDDALKHHCGVL